MNKTNNTCSLDTKNNCRFENTIDDSCKQHWNKAYYGTLDNKLGWYEEDPEPSLRLIKKSNLSKNDTILNVGAGTSTLIDVLCNEEYKNIIVNDISSTALEKLRKRLIKYSKSITWVEDDLINPTKLNDLGKINLWHDRAVLHFFTNPKDQETYFKLLRNVLDEKGYVIIATFNLNGAKKCCGLPVHQYDENMIQNKLGPEFELIESFNYTYASPSKDTREYIYTLFRKD